MGKLDKIACAVILVAWLVVLVVGLMTPLPMIGDEVTHYYMLVTQADKLPVANFDVQIPMGDGSIDHRMYPHVFLWHYVGAAVYLLFGKSFTAVQVYQSLFWLQFLIVGWLLSKPSSPTGAARGSLLYLLILISLPIALLFSVALYQDVPATAQVMTSFLLLKKRKLAWSLFFLGVAFECKETIIIFFPIYIACIVLFYRGEQPRRNIAGYIGFCLVGLVLLLVGTNKIFRDNKQSFYPYYTTYNYMERCWRSGADLLRKLKPMPPLPVQPLQPKVKIVAVNAQETAPVVEHRPEISNHPGDLRNPINFLVYGGGFLWLAAGVGSVCLLLGVARFPSSRGQAGPVAYWGFLVGGWYLALTAIHMRTAPDARFFLSGLPFVLLPLTQAMETLPWRRVWLPVFACGVAVQSGVVLKEAYNLRHVPGGVLAAVEYLKANPPAPNKVFMYPEGNYRLFPCGHDWYLDYWLKDFWKANDDIRIRMLHRFKLGAIVVKKYRIGKLDPEMNNLGIYPDSFVRDIDSDRRFKKILDNRDVVIYAVPPPDSGRVNTSP